MNIQEMHNVFRTLGQQMGIQLIRGILPESIDVFINEVINEKSRSAAMINANTAFQDKVSVQNNLISPINSLRTLYRTGNIVVAPIDETEEFYSVTIDISNVLLYTGFAVVYDNSKKRIGCRFVEGDKLETTLSDYCNRASWDAPIVTMFADSKDEPIVRLYIGDTAKKPQFIEVKYIELPMKVKWDKDLSNCVNCNLPEYEHNEIVELAVDKFFKSVGSTTQPVVQN